VPPGRNSRQNRVVISRNRRLLPDSCSNRVIHHRRPPRISTSYRSSRATRGMTLRPDPRRLITSGPRRTIFRSPSNIARFGGSAYHFGNRLNRPVQRSNGWHGSIQRRGPSQTIRMRGGFHHRRP
jgi:hypothetical protein